MKRCVFCGHRCYGVACQYHAHLVRLEAAMNRRPTIAAQVREAVQAARERGD